MKEAPGDSWLCGGQKMYEQFLHLCDEAFITCLKLEADGTSVFPKKILEELFRINKIIKSSAAFVIEHYVRK